MDETTAILTNYLPVLTLTAGWILDMLLGDPACLPHPVVFMGRWISLCEHYLNKGSFRIAKGAFFAISSILLCYSATIALIYILEDSFQYLSVIFQTVIVFFCLAGHTLRKEVNMVFKAVDSSIEEGRRQVARIVGRDTQQLTAHEIRTAALETLAENLSDGVIAPVFWFLVAGVPGMLTYKMVNTMDSMIAYKTPRYKDYGLWAARIDDVANFIPARLTALFMMVASFNLSNKSIRFLLRNSRQHASPNSGWPEAALASILDCRFGGTHNYFGQTFYKPYIGNNPRILTTSDMKRSIRICLVVEILSLTTVSLILIS